MDLVAALRRKISLCEEGDHAVGLKAVLLHLETAFRHLDRGQESRDDTAFTDAIYRSNQAFEGSIKEAYRVLAGMDPSKKQLFDIEDYLTKNNVFRPRVLNLFTNYRKEWRNPSAHDYKLDFDESESFLAIISVSAFACLLIDQITEKISFDKARHKGEASSHIASFGFDPKNEPFYNFVVRTLAEFGSSADFILPFAENEAQLQAGLHGYISALAKNFSVSISHHIGGGRAIWVDLLLSYENEKVPVELKRSFGGKVDLTHVDQVVRYLENLKVNKGVLFYAPDKAGQMKTEDIIPGNSHYTITAIYPQQNTLERTLK